MNLVYNDLSYKLTRNKYNPLFLLLIPLALSAFTHLWNIVGFPSIHIDESHYMRRTMLVMGGQAPQDPYYRYDHPYFGQIFLAWILGAIGYPNSLHPSTDVHSIEMLYLVPRVLMGLLAVADTFLIYKICERRYNNNRNIAFIASVLFAVMPMTWLLRRIYLDNILLPFLLSSILFAVYCTRDLKGGKQNNYTLALLSGIFLGLAIFTKIPAFTMIPLIGFLVYTNSNKNLKTLGLWFIPVIFIPLLWPIYSISVGQFSLFWDGVVHQANRIANTDLLDSIITCFLMDPILLIAGIAGIVFAAMKRDFVLLLWVVPLAIFLYFISSAQYFYVIQILPAFCVAAAIMIANLAKSIKIKKNSQAIRIIIISGIVIFGLVSTTLLITKNVNSTFFKVYAYIVSILPNLGNNNKETIIGDHWWIWNTFWIPKYVFHKEFNVIDLQYNIGGIVTKKLSGETVHLVRFPLKTSKVLFFGDENVKNIFSKFDAPLLININTNESTRFNHLEQLYNSTPTKATFIEGIDTPNQGYPYTSIISMTINENRPQGKIEIRANNWEALN